MVRLRIYLEKKPRGWKEFVVTATDRNQETFPKSGLTNKVDSGKIFSHRENLKRSNEKNQKFDTGSGKFEISIGQSSAGSWIHKSYAQENREIFLRVFTA